MGIKGTGKNKRRENLFAYTGKRSFVSVLFVLGILLLWFVVGELKIFSALIVPPPWRVIMAAGDIGIKLLDHFLATASRAILGFSLGATVGILIGFMMQYNRSVFIALDGLIESARPVPPVALVPFFILIFGFAEIGKVLLIVIGTGLIMVVTTLEGVQRIPKGVVRWGLVSSLTRLKIYRYIILPAVIPELKGGLRIALALAVTLVIVSEFMGASTGLGYLINISKVTLSTPTIVLCIFLTGWLNWLLDYGLRHILSPFSNWDAAAKEVEK